MDVFVKEHEVVLAESKHNFELINAKLRSETTTNRPPGTSAAGAQEEGAGEGAGAPPSSTTSTTSTTSASSSIVQRRRSGESESPTARRARRGLKSATRQLERAVQATLQAKADSVAVMGKAWKLAEYHMGKMLEVRKSQSLDKIDDLVALWECTQKFVSFSSAHALSQGRPKSNALLNALEVQLKTYVNERQRRDATQLTTSLDRENWRQVQVSYRQQLQLASIFKAGEGEDWMALNRKVDAKVKVTTASARGAVVPGELRYGTQRWKIVGSLLTLSAMLCDYIYIANRFPAMALLVTRGALNLLQLFNQVRAFVRCLSVYKLLLYAFLLIQSGGCFFGEKK